VFSGGSTKELLLQLVETEDIGPSDLEFIRTTASERATKTGKKRTS